MSENLDPIPIGRSAYRHAVSEEDIRHAVRMRLRTLITTNEMIMIIGPARDGAVLETGIGHSGHIVHAMAARRKYWP